MIAHNIEGVCKETIYVRRVSGITDASGVNVSLAAVVFDRVVIRVAGWIGITMVLQHVYAGATSVGGVGVLSDAE